MNEKKVVEILGVKYQLEYIELRGMNYYENGKPYYVGLYRVLVNGELSEIVVKTGEVIHRTFTVFQSGLAMLYFEGFVEACSFLKLT